MTRKTLKEVEKINFIKSDHVSMMQIKKFFKETSFLFILLQPWIGNETTLKESLRLSLSLFLHKQMLQERRNKRVKYG